MKLDFLSKTLPLALFWFAFVSCQDKSPLENYDPTNPDQEIPSDGDDDDEDDPVVVASNHPRIWITQKERPEILKKIETTPWAADLVSKMKSFIKADVDKYLKDKKSVIGAISKLKDDDDVQETASSESNTAHTKVLFKAEYAAILYYLYPEDEKANTYAQYAADIMMHYFFQLSARTPDKTTVCGYEFYDARCSFAKLALIYDFVYSYLAKEGTKVYNHQLGADITYDNDIAQKAIRNIAGNIFQEYNNKPDNHGRTVSNHPILTGPGALYCVMCVQDPAEHERLLNLFWEKGTWNQASFKNTILPMFGEQGIWPESVSYGFMPGVPLVLNILDRYKPEWKVLDGCDNILNGNFLFDNLRYPDRSFVSFGDSHRYNDGTDELYWITLDIAKRMGRSDLQKKAETALQQRYDAVGPFAPGVTDSPFDIMSVLLPLFWCESLPGSQSGAIDFQTPTVNIKHAGVSLQRNFVKMNNVKYGLCGYIGGGFYVHNQVAGISMELYGAGCVMAPSGGLPKTVAERNESPHKDYFTRYAGNNTVIVNETSHGSQQQSWKANWYTFQNTATNAACEPKHLEQPINANFSFTTQKLDDNVNNCNQERTLAILRTSPTTGYYFDMFRSKSNTDQQLHDYIYHNLGDKVIATKQNGDALSFSSTNKYTNHNNTTMSPGWTLLENKMSTAKISDGVKACFELEGACMNMWMPGGEEREYTTALGPKTRDIAEKTGDMAYSYLSKKTPVMIIRQDESAWEKPYVIVFEPAQNRESSIKSVDNLYYNNEIVGAKVVSQVDGQVITDYVICNDSQSGYYKDNDIEFTGRYAVVRIYGNGGELYIGDGETLKYKNTTLAATGRKATKKL